MSDHPRRRPSRSEVYSAAPSDRTEVAVPPGASFQLERLADGGFRLVDAGGRAVTAHPDSEGWRLDTGLLRRRTDLAGGGYLLLRGTGPDAAERGRSMRPAPDPRTADGVGILLDDGRLFEVRSAFEGGELGFELRGWEVSGAYLRAVPAGTGWAIVPTPAGARLEGTEAIVLLLAAELAGLSGARD